ncbi:MAG: LarC family nickel insertion protein [Rhodospirillales bacterium]|nr:LarC family nickel insertion protein [Rhodospirillales bacterium]
MGRPVLAQIDQQVSAIHLDAVGGVAGDMFAAAILDACPNLWLRCEAAISALTLPAGTSARIETVTHKGFEGTRFTVQLPRNGKTKDHGHTPWIAIRSMLVEAPLEAGVRDTAIDIFTILAEAEAAVHGIAPDDVDFHEVGAIDSIVDISVAAVLIDALAPCSWSVGPLPQGRGQVKTQHGYIPVPAPATAKILEGFLFIDDGENGERVTPTGAAILKFLEPAVSSATEPRALFGTGMGFGTNKFESRANMLRAVLFGAPAITATNDVVEVLRCEIDDQTGEDLAVAVDHLRATDGVLDVCQWPVFGKKGRIATALQVLAQPARAESITETILAETTTLGVRRTAQLRDILSRVHVDADGADVKLAHRPGGMTAKAAIDDVSTIKTAKAREARRRAAENKALREGFDNDR